MKKFKISNHNVASLPKEREFDFGLSSSEVEAKFLAGLANGKQNIKTKSVSEILFTNIFTFFNFLFVALAIILFFFIPQTANGFMQFGFLGTVIINCLIGIVQELRAKHTIDKLSLISAPKVTAIRDGVKTEIKIENIVLDDIIYLSSGCQICADSVVEEGTIEVNESMLTGEPDAILKNVGDEILSGSFVVSGTAMTKVIRIGKENYATKISAGAKYLKRPNSEILRSLNKIVKTMAIIIVPLGILLFCMKYLVHQNINFDPIQTNIVQNYFNVTDLRLSPIVIKTIGTMIGMIPSGLVALSSAVFCISVIRLANHKTLTQDLYCVETLARVDVLCLDKTGTITEGSMEVQKLISEKLGQDEFKQILKNLNSSIGDTNATADSIAEFTQDLQQTSEAISFIPFSSARKWSSATFENETFVIGAPEFVFANLSLQQNDSLSEFAKEGYRVLALAKSTNSPAEHELPTDLEFLGYVLISDKIRKEAPDTLRFFKEEGVNIKIISGDNPITVSAVARRAGLEGAENYIDLSTCKTDEEVIDSAEKYTVFGRVTPDQKLLLVKTLKKLKHTVAMTGDGVNDVLALKEADCSIAMASGSDAAKNVSSLVLLDSNFASMPRVVAEGRRSINNLERSAALFLVKTMYNLLFALVFSLIPQQLPYDPADLTIIGTFTIGIPSFFLALEPNKERVTGKFITKVLSTSIPGALTVFLSVMGVVVASKFVAFSNADLNGLFYLMTTISSFIFLARVCWKFNMLRSMLFVLLIGAFVAMFFVNIPALGINLPEIFGMPQSITKDMVFVILCDTAIVLPLFFLFVFLSEKFLKKKGYLDKGIDKMQIIEASNNKKIEAITNFLKGKNKNSKK